MGGISAGGRHSQRADTTRGEMRRAPIVTGRSRWACFIKPCTRTNPFVILVMTSSPPPPYASVNPNNLPDGPYRRALEELQRHIAARQEALQRGDEHQVECLDDLILVAMSAASDAAPDAAMRSTWAERARAYAHDHQARSGILKDIGFGVMVVLAAPVALAGGAVFAAGAIVYGAGKLIVGLGRALTFKAFD
jgi:hypothetical protein